jgi:hypothetical protein
MIRQKTRHNLGQASVLLSLLLALLAICCTAALAADTITGVVRNQTRGQFAASDEVILLRLDQITHNHRVPEEARVRTDPQGSFAVKVRDPDAVHLLRVIHDGVNYDVNYDRRVSTGNVVSIDVFDAATHVQGVTGTIEIIRVGTNGNLLHVSDMIEISNESTPPRTQGGANTFEVFLPVHAQLDSVLAASSGSGPRAGSTSAKEAIGMMISAAPVTGEPGHYTVNFPLRPGATKFAFNYDLPYSGNARFTTRNAYRLQQLAVMIPPTMKFVSPSSAFHILQTGNSNYQVETATRLKAGEGPRFEVSGEGPLPTLNAHTQSPSNPSDATQLNPALSASAQSPTQLRDTDASQSLPVSGTSTPSSRPQWWLAAGAAALLLSAVGFLFGRKQRLSHNPVATAAQKQSGNGSSFLIEALKEEISQLELERLHGTISGEEYISAKQALEETVQRALTRVASGCATRNLISTEASTSS